MKKVLLLLAVAAAVGLLAKSLFGKQDAGSLHYRLVTVTRGDVEAVVSATGTLDAVTTVQVGTQVSGIIDEICVDFNDPVTEGQVIARIDTTLLANAVAGNEAQVARSEAELRLARREHERLAALHADKLVSDSEFNQTQYQLDAALASVQSAQVDLTRSRQNLSYATVTAPIGGTVINRSVDVGQTVQASFSAPELFLIAGDLSRMQILAAVDESDIGQIAEGQSVRFTVQAYPDETFTGSVRQVRLQSTTQENVVNYTAVVDVENPDGVLLPGMTATVDFLVETAADVLYVANAALRYKPDQDVMQAAFEELRAQRAASGQERPGSGDRTGGPPADLGTLWTADEDGRIAVIPVRTGISDGTSTVVVGMNLEEDCDVIAGVSSSAAAAEQSGSPFQQQNSGRRNGPPPAGGF